MDKVEMQKKEENETVKKEVEEKKEEVQETPKGFYLAEVPETYRRFVALGDKEVDEKYLLVEMAKHLMEQTGFKLKE
jgi:hypothetical protein